MAYMKMMVAIARIIFPATNFMKLNIILNETYLQPLSAGRGGVLTTTKPKTPPSGFPLELRRITRNF